ncbi:ornithine cyclodeaminase family protein [Methanofollis fontis]|uniref:Ornithine cyclodeaminase family protein n=2 Tax=Methanofollis fontis TaxID=2052832 RepID=A0A483CT71_9EURY|nr:ornithine cyclodeaminase family protein [Methanofollis fontis]
MWAAIDAMRRAFIAHSQGTTDTPLRNRAETGIGECLSMPAAVTGPEPALSVKVVTLFPNNEGAGLPLIHGAVLVFHPGCGRPLALMEGSALTAIRTGAASGLATDLLSRPGSSVAAVIGAGVQARTQIEAVCAVRPIEEVRVYARKAAHVRNFVNEMSDRGFACSFIAADSPDEALRGADIVCTATSSMTPVFCDSALEDGTHVNAVGAYRPDMQEIPGETICRARLFVDAYDAASVEAGDIIIPLSRGLITPDSIAGEIGQAASGTLPGRLDADGVTLFKSVGIGVQDTYAAVETLKRAEMMGIGSEVPW